MNFFRLLLSSVFLIIGVAYSSSDLPYKVECFAEQVEDGVLSVKFKISGAADVKVYAEEANQFLLSEKSSDNLGVSEIIFPKLKEIEEDDLLDIGKKKISKVFNLPAEIIVRKKYLKSEGENWSYSGSITTQGCQGASCYIPEEVNFYFKGKVLKQGEKAKIANTWSDKLDHVKPNVQEKLPLLENEKIVLHESKVHAAESKKHIYYYLLLAFVGGFILNFMPCVLPVLSIKAMSLVNSANNDKKEILKGSIAYTSGILASFFAMALLIIGIRRTTGEERDWGFLMQEPAFIIFLIILIWCFSLSLFDVFVIQLPGMTKANELTTKKHGHLGSFISGVFAVFLATPCTAPMLGSAIAFLLEKSDFIIAVSFLVIGLGLALPFLLLGLFPSALKIIPKPGNWMNTFKEVMGFLLFGTCLFLMFPLQSLLGDEFYSFLLFLLPLSIGCWAYGKYAAPWCSKWQQIIVSIITVVALVIFGYFFINIPKVEASSNISEEGNDLVQTLSPVLLKERRTVFVSVGAEWCATCILNERNVISSSRVQEAMEANNIHYVKFDYTKRDPLIADFIRKFGRRGVPLYVIFKPSEKGQDVKYELLPEIITENIVIKSISE